MHLNTNEPLQSQDRGDQGADLCLLLNSPPEKRFVDTGATTSYVQERSQQSQIFEMTAETMKDSKPCYQPIKSVGARKMIQTPFNSTASLHIVGNQTGAQSSLVQTVQKPTSGVMLDIGHSSNLPNLVLPLDSQSKRNQKDSILPAGTSYDFKHICR